MVYWGLLHPGNPLGWSEHKASGSFFLLNCALRFPGARSSTFSLLPCTGQATGSRVCGASEVTELLQQQVPFPGKPHCCWVCGRGSNLQPKKLQPRVWPEGPRTHGQGDREELGG